MPLWEKTTTDVDDWRITWSPFLTADQRHHLWVNVIKPKLQADADKKRKTTGRDFLRKALGVEQHNPWPPARMICLQSYAKPKYSHHQRRQRPLVHDPLGELLVDIALGDDWEHRHHR